MPWLNSLWPSDAIYIWHLYDSILAQVMACCLAAPSHYLNQRWLIFRDSFGICLRIISQEMLKTSIFDMNWIIYNLRLQQNLQGAEELINLHGLNEIIHLSMMPKFLSNIYFIFCKTKISTLPSSIGIYGLITELNHYAMNLIFYF